MQLQSDIELKKQERKEQEIKFLTEIVEASARFERLLANSDFVKVLEDLKRVAQTHDEEIQGYLKAYSFSTSFFKKMRLAEVLGQHQMRKDAILEAISYPSLIVEKAREAREKLAQLKSQEKELSHV